jgi:hypothetical protein
MPGSGLECVRVSGARSRAAALPHPRNGGVCSHAGLGGVCLRAVVAPIDAYPDPHTI